MWKPMLSSSLRIVIVCLLPIGASLLKAQSAASPAALTPYTSCQFTDGLQIVQVDPLPPGITSREVQTDSGPRQIAMDLGIRIMFAYPETDFYANVKAEELPSSNYQKLKKDLLDNFKFLSHGNTVNAALKSPMNGFEVHGLDREKLEGGTLGIYLLFDEPTHIVTTIYLLNQEPQNRKFQTMDEYRNLRDRFLNAYSSCIRGKL
jgi:hypothetical protein